MRCLLTIMLSALLALSSVPVWAQDGVDPAVAAEAEERSRLGVQYYQEGRFPEAVREMKAAYKLVPDPGLLYNIARIYQRMDEPQLALDTFSRFVQDDNADPERVEKALGHIKTLRTQVAEADKKEDDEKDVVIEPPGGATPDEPDFMAVWIVGGAGIGALLVGGTLGGLALAAQEDVDSAILPYEKKVSAQSRGETLAILSDVAYGLGVAAVGTAVALYFLTDESPEAASETAPTTIVPTLGPDQIGAALQWRFE